MKIFINPGNVVSSSNELNGSEVTLNVGRKVADHLSTSNFETECQQLDGVEKVYTSSNDWGAELFISIQCNAASASVSGTETFYCQGSANGKKLAQAIQSRIVSTLGTVDRGIKDDTQTAAGSLGVLRHTKCPAVLVELAFISNPDDVKLLSERQDDFAKAIAAGIMDYCGVEANITDNAAPNAEPYTKLEINLSVVSALALKCAANNTDPAAYGKYKFSSNVAGEFAQWLSNHSDEAFANYGRNLAEDEAGSDKFTETWNNLATVDPGNFSSLQDEFVQTMYFDKAAEALAKEYFHLDKHSDAMKAVIFARALQNGAAECVDTVKNACTRLNQPNLSYVDSENFDADIINAIYDSLSSGVAESASLEDERKAALDMLNGSSI